MIVTQGDIELGLKELGIKKGDTILIHSSLKSFGTVKNGADTVVDAFLSVLGDEGTLIVPTLTGKHTDSPVSPPYFDICASKSWTGKIPETVRLRQDAKRSLHPTHSVSAIGGRRDEIVASHENGNSPCDEHSPYYKNCIWGGYILLIGVDQESNTTIHCCEEIAKVPYHLQTSLTDIRVEGYDHNEVTVRNYLHDWNKPATDFMYLESFLESRGVMKKKKIGGSLIRLIDASGMLEETVKLLKHNPLFFIKKL
jgi:aminoglycoside 3-N-acetyltransferase